MHSDNYLNTIYIFFFLIIRRPPKSTLFPTRRSSDLARVSGRRACPPLHQRGRGRTVSQQTALFVGQPSLDRKSTRLNSSHSQISYAVFCLKKKKVLRNVSGV